MYRNGEGYNDPTAGRAIGNVAKEESKRKHKQPDPVASVADMMRKIASFAGFEVVGSIKLKDRVTGKEYRV